MGKAMIAYNNTPAFNKWLTNFQSPAFNKWLTNFQSPVKADLRTSCVFY